MKARAHLIHWICLVYLFNGMSNPYELLNFEIFTNFEMFDCSHDNMAIKIT